ncbi:MAG: hypothetical protein RLZZ515_1556, partial [Cyanobacteriota bacterium]
MVVWGTVLRVVRLLGPAQAPLLRLYAVLFLTGLAGSLGWVPLPSGLRLLQEPAMLYASGGLLAI